MANPFLGPTNSSAPSQVTNTRGDGQYYTSTPYHLAAFVIFALTILVALKMSGFRAMVGIGRG